MLRAFIAPFIENIQLGGVFIDFLWLDKDIITQEGACAARNMPHFNSDYIMFSTNHSILAFSGFPCKKRTILNIIWVQKPQMQATSFMIYLIYRINVSIYQIYLIEYIEKARPLGRAQMFWQTLSFIKGTATPEVPSFKTGQKHEHSNHQTVAGLCRISGAGSWFRSPLHDSKNRRSARIIAAVWCRTYFSGLS